MRAHLLFCPVTPPSTQARYRAAERPETGLALASAVRALAADGFAGLHILVHSMGTRVLMNALPHLEAILAEEAQRGGAAATEAGAASAARPGGEGVGGGGGGMKLLTVTICNPDYGLRPFVREMGFRLRALCPIVTIYGDTADGALGLSVSNKGPSCDFKVEARLPGQQANFAKQARFDCLQACSSQRCLSMSACAPAPGPMLPASLLTGSGQRDG